MKVIVTGGRNFNDKEKVFRVLSLIRPSYVIQGGASGADTLAMQWASENNVAFETYHADWSQYGKSAGPRRNLKMLTENESALVIAFEGGAGTENCIMNALLKKMVVLEVR